MYELMEKKVICIEIHNHKWYIADFERKSDSLATFKIGTSIEDAKKYDSKLSSILLDMECLMGYGHKVWQESYFETNKN